MECNKQANQITCLRILSYIHHQYSLRYQHRYVLGKHHQYSLRYQHRYVITIHHVLRISAGCGGWWLRKEVIILPVELEMLSAIYKVVRVTYLGNGKNANKDELWKNWEMMVEIRAPVPSTQNATVTGTSCQ